MGKDQSPIVNNRGPKGVPSGRCPHGNFLYGPAIYGNIVGCAEDCGVSKAHSCSGCHSNFVAARDSEKRGWTKPVGEWDGVPRIYAGIESIELPLSLEDDKTFKTLCRDKHFTFEGKYEGPDSLPSTPRRVKDESTTYQLILTEKQQATLLALAEAAVPAKPIEKSKTIYLEFCETVEAWQPSKPRRATIGPQEFRAPWFGASSSQWVTPTFDLIPLSLYLTPIVRLKAGYSGQNGNSRIAPAKPLTNFCLDCFTRSEVTQHSEGGFEPGFFPSGGTSYYQNHCVDGSPKESGKWITTRVFARSEKRCGVYTHQEHAQHPDAPVMVERMSA